jgi:hypothetical protein
MSPLLIVQACRYFHEEKTCARYLEHGQMKQVLKMMKIIWILATICLKGGSHYPLSQENMQQVKDKAIDVGRATRIFGERPSQEEIQNM